MGADNSVLEQIDWEDGRTVTTDELVVKTGRFYNGDKSVSLLTAKEQKKGDNERLRKCSKRVMSIRHPSILHYITSGEGSNGPYLLTDQVVPLTTVVDNLSSIDLCAGLYNILEALSFLHEKVGLCHNNVCPASIFVCTDGSWQLGGLEYACSFTEASLTFLKQCSASRSEDFITPEEKQGKIEATKECGAARDIFGFAIMAEEFLGKLAELGDMTKTFALCIQDECLSLEPKQRPCAQTLLKDKLFTNEFLEVAVFLKQIAMKTEQEKKEFFKCLLPKLLRQPEDLIGRRLVSDLLCRFVLLDQSANEFIIPHLFTPSKAGSQRSEVIAKDSITPIFTQSAFKTYVVPELVKIFRVHELHIRLLLLNYFSEYVSLIDKEVLEDSIFPQILLGLRDVNEMIAVNSLRALADLIPILGRATVIGGKAKTYFREGKPKTLQAVPTSDKSMTNHNVSGMMGKVLLKDLAAFSSNNIKEQKMKEREKRREEAKRKRDMRKKQRNDTIIKGEKLTSVCEEEIESHEFSTANSKQDVEPVNDSVENEDNINIHEEDRDNDWSDEESESEKKENQTSHWSKEENGFAVNEMEKPDLTEEPEVKDFNENDDDDEFESWGSDISSEIERELQDMEAPTSSQDIKIPFDNSYSDTKVVNYSNQPNNNSLNKTQSKAAGVLKLKSQTTKSKPVTPSEVSVDDLLGQQRKDDSVSNIPQTSPSISNNNTNISMSKSVTDLSQQTGVPLSSRTGAQRKLPKVSDSLGAEFDVKSVEIKPLKSKDADPLDFFADMEPQVKTVSIPLFPVDSLTTPDQNDGVSSLPASQANNVTKSTVSFAMVEAEVPTTDAGTGDGWGDEDWGEDF